jgi:hypothetical protein
VSGRPDPERSPGPWLPALGAPKPCAQCGEMFRPSAPRAKYCSRPCHRKALEARRAEKAQGGPSRVDISPPKEGG